MNSFNRGAKFFVNISSMQKFLEVHYKLCHAVSYA